MTYAQARWAGVVIVLKPWLQRLAVGLLLTLAATASGSGAPLTLLKMLAAGAAWSVLPLHAAGWWGLPLQAALVGALLLLLRPMLLPARWLELERSLPLAPGPLGRTDALLALYALSPLLLLQAVGLGALAQPRLLLAWIPGSAAGLAIGLAAMRVRRWPRALRHAAAPATQRVPHTTRAAVVSPSIALLWLPLWRGPLRGSARVLLGLTLTLALLPGLLWSPLPPTLVAMVWVACAWLGLQRANAALDAELPGLLAALPPLPLDVPTWRRRLHLLALLPWLLALPCLLAALLAGPSLRSGVAAALGLLLGAMGLWSALTRWRADDAHAVRLLLGLAVMLALASEVFV